MMYQNMSVGRYIALSFATRVCVDTVDIKRNQDPSCSLLGRQVRLFGIRWFVWSPVAPRVV